MHGSPRVLPNFTQTLYLWCYSDCNYWSEIQLESIVQLSTTALCTIWLSTRSIVHLCGPVPVLRFLAISCANCLIMHSNDMVLRPLLRAIHDRMPPSQTCQSSEHSHNQKCDCTVFSLWNSCVKRINLLQNTVCHS